jgi:hypothetical protein
MTDLSQYPNDVYVETGRDEELGEPRAPLSFVPSLVPADPYAAIAGTTDDKHTTITASTTETNIIDANSQFRLGLYGLVIANTDVTAVVVTIRDKTGGSVRDVIAVPAGETRGFILSPLAAKRQKSGVNNPWTATCSVAVTSCEITAHWVRLP